MTTVDGSIRIPVEIDTGDAKQTLRQLKDEITKDTGSSAQGTPTGTMAQDAAALSAQLKQVNRDIDALLLKRANLTAGMTDGGTSVQQQQLYALNEEMFYARQAQAELNAQIAQMPPAYDRAAKGAKKTAGAAQELSRETKTASKHAADLAGSMGNRLAASASSALSSLKRMGLALFSIRSAYALLSRAAQAYLSENETLSGQINACWASVGSFVGPIIGRIVGWLQTAIGYVNAFIQALTGINFLARRNANALNKQAKATGAAGGAAQKAQRQIAGFDEINKLNDQSASGGGGGGGGSSAGVYTVPEIKLPDWGARIAESIKLGDWKSAGAELGKQTQSLLDKIPWEQMSSNVSKAWCGLFDFGSGFLQNINWQELGYNIETFFQNIDRGAIASSASEFIGSLFGALIGSIWGSLKAAWQKAVSNWKEELLYWSQYLLNDNGELKGLGEGLIEGLFQGIVDKFKNIGTWIVENIFDPFINGFKNAFGIHSPSTVMDEQGGFLMSGLLEGIKKWIEPVVGVVKSIWKSITGVFQNVGAWFSKRFSEAWEGIKKIFDPAVWRTRFSSIWSSVTGVFSAVSSWFGEKFRAAYAAVTGAFSGFTSFFSGLWDKIKTTFSMLGTSIGSAISNAVKSGINGVLSMIENTINGAIRLINGAIGLINKIPGVSVGRVGTLRLPRLARGGIVSAPGRGVPLIAGEAGKEAVLPLEKNTEWMDLLAEKLGGSGGQIVIPVYLGAKKIAETIIDLNEKRAFALNRG